MIAIDLSKQQALDADPNAINFTGNLNQDESVNDNTIMFFHNSRSKRNHFRIFTRNC